MYNQVRWSVSQFDFGSNTDNYSNLTHMYQYEWTTVKSKLVQIDLCEQSLNTLVLRNNDFSPSNHSNEI